MNSSRPAAGAANDRDFDWMEGTYPLHEDWIQGAIDELAARNEQVFARSEREPGTWQQARELNSGSMYTRVTGPVAGYYIAAYAQRAGATGTFVGTYKICEVRPASFWDAACLLSGTCRHTESTGNAALEGAEAAATRQIDGLPILV